MSLPQEKQMMVYVERRAADDAVLLKDESFGAVRNQLCTFREGKFPLPPRSVADGCFDIACCLC